MNILPHKSWHVRTKANIDRVRKDQAKAAQEAKDLDKRIKLADQEARTSYLRKRAQQRKSNIDENSLELIQNTENNQDALQTGSDSLYESCKTNSSMIAPSGHVNFFQDLENGETTLTTNKEREEEEKKEKEEHEKKIGVLTYLGQDSNELTGETSWWQKLPENRDGEVEEKDHNLKQQKHLEMLDPLSSVRQYLGCKGVQHITASITEKEKKSHRRKKKRRRYSSSCSADSDVSSSKKKKKSLKKKDRKKDKKSYSRKESKRKSDKSKNKKYVSKKKSKSRDDRNTSNSDSYPDEKRRKSSERSAEATTNEADNKRLKIEKLRIERVEREKKERIRRHELLYGVQKDKPINDTHNDVNNGPDRKYNSQFNPQFAKQNKLDASQKYWLQ